MKHTSFPSIKAAGKKRSLNVRKDTPDIRDRMYEPSLNQLKLTLDKRNSVPKILDQGQEGSCTGFGLAAVINLLNTEKRNLDFTASPRMLYEMAKKHDEWPGEDYSGSSCRGAIRGWKNMGVCSDHEWPYDINNPGELTIEHAYEARSNTLGSYYRLRADINDYHAALNEVGAIYVSANVHSGWEKPKTSEGTNLAVIKPSNKINGGHAFAIVGYNNQGFVVQNSWGIDWGSDGFALWLYEDWLNNISDGWVFRLAVPTPQVFGLTAHSSTRSETEIGKSAPKRLEIAGHFAHFDDGKLKTRGDYWSTLADIQNTAERIKASIDKKGYDHLLIYAHGGLNSSKDSASRIAALKEGFKRNRIYPLHVMYDTGLAEELKDTIIRAYRGKQMEGFLGDLKDKLVDMSDTLIEDIVRKPVTPLWEEMKRDAYLPFKINTDGVMSDGLAVISIFAESLKETGIKIHMAGHSTGAVLLGHLLNALDVLKAPELIQSCSLMAPACSIDFYNQYYKPRLANQTGDSSMVKLPSLDIYNLTKRLEQDDNVSYIYRKSLLFLVSRALERQIDKPILGMQHYSKNLPKQPGLHIHYSNGKKGNITRSSSHGGFDNDFRTLNSIMKRILSHEPPKPFEKNEMEGY
jgi:Papain family cysteine protease